ncbi:50S ribosomal protein L25 [Paenibacillaceae bacterium WGS1546]|uniref:50S ribosomal protein L25 n=1 Tax=Cohnella sp. WGS1546 TaxID=3366810 RepID=UPI00372CF90C
MSATLRAQAREASTKGEIRRIRTEGRIPGVVYGKGLEEPSSITVDAKELAALLRGQPNAVIDMEVPGAGKQPVMMTDLQRDPLSKEMLHVDFRRIDMNAKITTSVRVETSGTSTGEKEGGMLQLVLHEIEIECYPKDIPEAIVADVGGLGVGEHLTIGELALPDGVAANQDPDTVVVAVLAPQKERTAEETEALEDEAEEDRKHEKAAQAVEKD